MSTRRHLSQTFGRYPRLAHLLYRGYRQVRVPRYTAGALGVLQDSDGRLLLVEHVVHFGKAWGMPGGWLDRNEDPAECVRREFYEETRLRVRVLEPLLVCKGQAFAQHLDFAYRVELDGPGEPVQLSRELLSYGWFALNALPPLRQFPDLVVQELMKRGTR
ncbi:MAG: NUDIX hydrolase [Anaerolineae bacterium]|nr:NUDIX hydrolase [Anaerolineae bacterium]